MFGYTINVGGMPIPSANITERPVHAMIATGWHSKPQNRAKLHQPSMFVEFCDLTLPRPRTSGPPTSAMSVRDSFDPKTFSYILGTIHNKQGNILFMDGSVRSYRREFLYLYSLPGQTEPWN
jgi:prepilin-type processing-associated H-X9-DG protein